ncbi:hypothetical protein AB0E69_38920 [Kribbella sp. NPDC026611]|uniref:hypothetical protein n=1 Tax=Kribbella sp. NPDC026611 TaxID=3154911 RepID=UPI00340E9EEE
MADERSQAERWVSFAAGIVTPITLISTLLFYFGYVSARSQYEYFGIDVDTIGLSTQDYVMRSPQPLLLPLLGVTLLAVAALLLHNAIHPTAVAVRRAARVAVAVLLLGVAGLLAYPVIGHLPYYALVIPAVIGLSAAALAYLTHLRQRTSPPQRVPPDSTQSARPDPAQAVPPEPTRPATSRSTPVLGQQRVLIILLAFVTVVCTFWATATTAQYSGRGLAKSDARHLNRFPVVILDTKEKLALRSPGLEETALRQGAGQTFNYRYRGLRLLVVGENRLFLVPQTWTPSNTTIVLPLDNNIRVQFQFENDPP